MYTIEEFDMEKTKVLKYIMFKKRTEKEIKNKFSKLIEPNLLDDIIEYLKEANYINDEQYLKKIVDEYIALKNMSLKELQYKLMAKGLEKDLIEDYMYNYKDKLEEYEIKSITNIIYKKSASMEQEEIKQYLLKKGYKIDNINTVLENEN